MPSEKQSRYQSNKGYQQLDRPWPQDTRSIDAINACPESHHNQSLDTYLEAFVKQQRDEKQDLTPMERWLKDTVQDQPWNDAAAFLKREEEERMRKRTGELGSSTTWVTDRAATLADRDDGKKG